MRHAQAPVLVLSLALAACSSTPKTPPAPDAGCDPADPACAVPACQIAEDCGDVRLYDCVSSACKPVCTSKADCNVHPAYKNGPWPGCAAGTCICDSRTCVSSFCTSDPECGAGQVCKSGTCSSPDLTADSCAITPSVVVLRRDQALTFRATAYQGDTVALLGPNGFVWTAGDVSVGKLDEGGTFKGAFANNLYKEGAVKAAVRANPAITCSAKVMVVDAVSNGARVILLDSITGRLVSGATVVLNGATLTEDGSNKGIHTLANVPAASPNVVSVFHKDYQYVSVVGLVKTDLLIPLRRDADPKKGGGYQGTFTNFPQSEVALGFAGSSIAGNFTDLDLSTFTGHLQDTDVVFNSQTKTLPLPSGAVIGLGATKFKDRYAVWGGPGECPDEAATLAHSCGTSAAFGLMGTVPLLAATPLLTDGFAGKDISIGKVLGVAVPYLSGFKSSVVRDVAFKLKDVPTDPTALYADLEAFPKHDMAPAVAMGLKQIVNVPDLPVGYAGAQLDAAVVIAASQVPGRGVVPLGLTAGLDSMDECPACTNKGKVIGIDVKATTPAVQLAYHDDGRLNLSMAPNHDGIEGSRYGIVTLALSTAGLANGASATSGLVASRNSVPSGTEISYEGGFLGFVDGAYDFRTSKFSAVKLLPGAGVHRAVFTAADGKGWTVYFNKTDFDMPKPPAGFEDRTIADKKARTASPDSARASLSWWSMKAADASSNVGLDELFDASAGRAMNLSSFVSGFSVYDAEPGLAFVAPAGAECGTNAQVPGACTVKDGTYEFKVKVTGFEVPAKVKLLFEANTGEQVLVDAVGADWVAATKFKTALQKDDDLANPHVITVTMVKPDATDATKAVPIDPKVRASMKLLVQE